MKLYQVVAQELEGMIRGRTLNSGDQLPSVRAFCQARKISPSTVLRAYELLESHGLIEARSCERFRLLSDALAARGEAKLAAFYDELFAAEARHYRVLLDLAVATHGDETTVRARLAELAHEEGELSASLGEHASIHG